MTLRAIESFLDMAGIASGSAYGLTDLSPYGLPYSVQSGDTGGNARAWQVELEGDWLKMTMTAAVAGSRWCGIGRNFSDFGINPVADSVLYGGFRFKLNNVGTMPTSSAYFSKKTNGTQTFQLFAISAIPNFALNAEFYCEWMVDFANNVIKNRVDGIDMPDIALNGTLKAYLLAGNGILFYGSGAGSSSAQTWWYKDAYVLEKSADGIMSGWLGPQVVRRVKLADAVAPWPSSSGASVKDTLNAALTDPASRLTPYITSDADTTEAVLKVDTTAIQGKITAVAIGTTFRRNSGKVGFAEMSLTSGGVTSSKQRIPALPTMTSYYNLFLGSLAPNNVAWTKELLASTTIKIKPVA